MKPNIMIAGQSGRGKSTSLRNLDGARTAIINTEQKALPFRGANKFTKSLIVKNYQEFLVAFERAMSNPDIDVVVIDSFTSLTEMIHDVSKVKASGFGVWAFYADEVHRVIKMSKGYDKYVVWIGIDEPIQDENGVIMRSVRVEGKKLKGAIEKEFVIVLWADVLQSEDGKRYVFQTNNHGDTTAKSPMEMFLDEYIDNDLNEVIKTINQYYEGE